MPDPAVSSVRPSLCERLCWGEAERRGGEGGGVTCWGNGLGRTGKGGRASYRGREGGG